MPYCSKCGVEVDAHLKRCPLCRFPIQKIDDEVSLPSYPGVERNRTMSNREIRLLSWQIIITLFTISFFVVMVTDLIINGSFTWSGYAMTGIALAAFVITFILLFFRTPLVIIICNCTATIFFLLLIDSIDSKLQWFWYFGLPIWLTLTVIIVVAYILIRTLKNPGLNVAGIILAMTGLFCMELEMLITGFFGHFSIKWSFIVLAAVIPLSVFFITYHYSFSKKFDIKKVFHV